MMTNVVIRQASHEDLDTLLQLRMEVLHNSGQLNYGDSEELEEASWHYYQSALTDGSHIACIATGDGRVLGCGGMCLHSEMPSSSNPSGKCACLMNIYVSHDGRTTDIGRDIVAWLIAYAHRRNITKIYLESSVAARYMFHSIGFRCMPDMMILTGEAG